MLGSLDSYNEPVQEGILATAETDELLVDSLRKQIISFKNMNLIDSTNKIYILPVGQADLSEEEYVDDKLGLLNSFGRGSYRNMSRAFNNIVLFESIENHSEIIFKERISVSHYVIIRRENNIYLLITATDKDSNKDKYLNEDDLQGLYLYEVSNRKLTKIELIENFTALDIYGHGKTKDAICKFGIDKDSNGIFEYRKEPIIYYIFDFETKKLIQTVPDAQINKLQQLLEGR